MDGLLPAYFFKGLSVIHLTVQHDKLSKIEDQAFEGLQDKLETLDLSYNSLVRFPTESLKVLSSLVSLDLNSNQLEVLHANCLTGLISLLRLSLYGNRLKTIDSLAFEGIGGNLTRINLGGNRLTAFPSTAFKNLTSLQLIELHENRITSISRATFYGMTASDTIDKLNLASNAISEIPGNCFHDLKALTSLALEGNSLKDLHAQAFQGIEGEFISSQVSCSHYSVPLYLYVLLNAKVYTE